ncbi:MAG TPA: tRNA-dihydrouridine synthase family protein [Burkholderiaceae bacterium]|nr:tRNA-dihydrouridine synthase family protein [Burkholderiaceae bacterium]
MDFRGRVLLAPLTKGGNLPFRRLCTAFGCATTMSEMAYAFQVVRRRPTELALLRKHADEPCFGVQLAASKPADAIAAGLAAVERGAAFVDLNCGCPIHDVVKRGMGAVLLQRPAHLGRLVEAMVKALPVPVTVKIRLGWSEADKNASEVAQAVQAAGASALSVHGRTREQRYTKAADWDAIARLVGELTIPVIGNGDILTWYEAQDLQRKSGCASVMVGRGALIKPWLFRELAEGKEFEPGAEQRVAIYMQFVRCLKEHFRDDEKGRKRAMFFLPWHLGFFCRYRPLPEARFREQSRAHPLLQTRMPDRDEVSLLERLLRDPREQVHALLAAALWDAADDADAAARFLSIAAANPPGSGEAAEVAVAHG